MPRGGVINNWGKQSQLRVKKRKYWEQQGEKHHGSDLALKKDIGLPTAKDEREKALIYKGKKYFSEQIIGQRGQPVGGKLK